MTEDDPNDGLKTARNGMALLGEVIKAAGDNANVKAAGTELGQTALTVTKAINNCLLPLAALNFAVEKAKAYFSGRFQAEMAAKAASIPPEHVVEPKASIAGPALQALAFTHEEAELKEMYLNLLKSAMDRRTAPQAHPAFVEVIRQLSALEAKYVAIFLASEHGFAVAEVRLEGPGEAGWQTVYRHLLPAIEKETSEPVEDPNLPAYVDNWIRLGLVVVEYGKYLTGADQYSWVTDRPEFKRFKRFEKDQRVLGFERGVMTRTSFGAQFAKAIGVIS